MIRIPIRQQTVSACYSSSNAVTTFIVNFIDEHEEVITDPPVTLTLNFSSSQRMIDALNLAEGELLNVLSILNIVVRVQRPVFLLLHFANTNQREKQVSPR